MILWCVLSCTDVSFGLFDGRGNGMSHKPPGQLRVPFNNKLLFLITKKLCFVYMAVQSSLQSFPIDSSDELERPGSILAWLACGVNFDDS